MLFAKVAGVVRGVLWVVGLCVAGSAIGGAQGLGVFEGHGDVGKVLHVGEVRYDAARQTYTVSGSGENMWFGEDDFQFVWKKMSGDVALTADIAFVGTGGNKHRKAVLMMRQSLDGGSRAVDVARHGDGLTSLQYRDEPGATMHEVESAVSAPTRVRIERRGEYVYVYVSEASGRLAPSGASIKLALSGQFYVGLGVCAHDKNVTETAVFSNVKVEQLPPVTGQPVLYSTIETVGIGSTDRRVEYVAARHFEAPNWSRDGSYLLFNQEGGIERLTMGSTEPSAVPIEGGLECNNDHGLSPDGALMAISARASKAGGSQVYVVPVGGGQARQVTMNSPSYWHGWSPDGKVLAFTGARGGEFDIYTIPISGGQETRLTTAKGLDDGSEFSPDGRYLYFNSERTGSMQIWRMRSDGSEQEQVLADGSNDWFPHISPDGKWMVFVAYEKGVSGHPANKDVELRVMSLADKKVRFLARLFGGQGTMNVPSWSPDSSKVAFVSYELLPQGAGGR